MVLLVCAAHLPSLVELVVARDFAIACSTLLNDELAHEIDNVGLVGAQETQKGRHAESLSPHELLQVHLLGEADLRLFKLPLIAHFLFTFAAATAERVLKVHHGREQGLRLVTEIHRNASLWALAWLLLLI